MRVGLQRDLAAPVGAPHAGTGDGDLLTSQGGRTPLVAVPRVGAVGLTLVAPPAQPGHLVLQEAEATSMPSLIAKLSRESCIRPSNSSRSRGSWISQPEPRRTGRGWAGSGLWGHVASHRLVSRRFLLPRQGKSHVQSSDRTGGAALFTFQLRTGHLREASSLEDDPVKSTA